MVIFPILIRALVPSLFTIFLVIQPSIGDDDTQALISKICSQTSDYAFCSNVFNKNLPSPTTDIVGLTEITITQSMHASTTTEVFLVGLVGSEKNKTLQDLYKGCLDGYRYVGAQFEEANNSMARRDYKYVAYVESRTDKPVDDCQKNAKSSLELAEKNRQMKVLIKMALVSVNLIQK